MALTSPKIASTTAAAPQVWLPKSTASIWRGAVVGRYPNGSNAGYIDNIGADLELVVVGVARNNCGVVPSGHVATFAKETIVDEVILPMDFSTNSDCSTAKRGQIVYGVDESKASMSPGDGPPIGVLWECDSTTSGRVGIGPSFLALAAAGPAATSAASSRPIARAVMTSLAANAGTTTGVLTASANGALAAQDGVTIVVGDVLFIQEGTTNLSAASDAGPYQVVSLGGASAKWVFERPAWWLTGSTIPMSIAVDIGPEGTLFGGTAWKSFGGKGKVVDTDAPVFWPKQVMQKVTLVSGTLSAAKTNMPVRSASTTSIAITSLPTTAPHASTRVWRPSAVTAGVTGTASIQIVAESAPGTTNASDIGDYCISVVNF